MTAKQAPRRNVAVRQLGTIAVLALGAWVHPAFSATGAHTRCDQPIDAPQMSATVSETKLAIQVIDHGANTAMAADDISLDAEISDPALASPAQPAGPRVDIMLRPMYGEERLPQSKLAETEPTDDPQAPPLVVDKTETIEEPAALLDNDEVENAAELPGYSEDELLRYRQQMFRKDI